MPEHMTRAEHIQWAKDRALAYLNPPKLAWTGGGKNGEPIVYADTNGYEHRSWPPPVYAGQLRDACASFLSDLRKHPGFNTSTIDLLWAMEARTGNLATADGVRRFIEGIN